MRKAAESEGHSDATSDESVNTQSNDSGADGDAIYHELELDEQELKEKKQEFRKKLNQEARQLIRGSMHESVKLIVHRPEATLEGEAEYKQLWSELMPVIQQLVRKVNPLLEFELANDFIKSHVYGTKFNADRVVSQDFRYFSKKRPPEEEPTLVVALRIDESASMTAFNRLQSAKRTAVAVYEFCNQCGIPLLIYGDTADKSKFEQMSLFSYIDFEEGSLENIRL